MSDKQIMTAKSILRKKLYSVINNLPKAEIIRQSEIVTSKILQNETFQKAKVVSIYLSMDNEVQTESLLSHIFKQGKECFIPRFQVGSPIMEMIRLKSMEEYDALPRNKWNIKQPPDDEKIESVFDRGGVEKIGEAGVSHRKRGVDGWKWVQTEAEVETPVLHFVLGQLDIVLSPGLGFTKEGLRLGRGKGYYDRFYEKCKNELPQFPYTIGLAFTEQVLPEIPVDKFDFPLDLIVSP